MLPGDPVREAELGEPDLKAHISLSFLSGRLRRMAPGIRSTGVELLRLPWAQLGIWLKSRWGLSRTRVAPMLHA